jgi:hypothetical protein
VCLCFSCCLCVFACRQLYVLDTYAGAYNRSLNLSLAALTLYCAVVLVATTAAVAAYAARAAAAGLAAALPGAASHPRDETYFLAANASYVRCTCWAMPGYPAHHDHSRECLDLSNGRLYDAKDDCHVFYPQLRPVHAAPQVSCVAPCMLTWQVSTLDGLAPQPSDTACMLAQS